MAKKYNPLENPKPLLLIGGAILGYLYVIKPLLETLGLKKTGEEKEQDQLMAENQQNVQNWLNATASEEMPTKTSGEWSVIADQIYNDLKYSAIDDKKDDAVYQVCRVKNNADFALLFKAFGKRQEYFFGLPLGGLQNLQSFIVGNVTSDKIKEINNNYYRKGIRYRF